MSIFEYISQQFTSLGLVLSEADCVTMGLWNSSDELTQSNQPEVYRAFIQFIPSLLSRPSSISEGGVSITRAQRQDIEAFYSNECKKLGLRNEMVARVRFV